MLVQRKRIYDDPAPDDGTRVLVDRLWPRGVSKAEADLDEWRKDVAPSDELREWFDHDPAKWEEFARRYRDELEDTQDELERLREYASEGTLTLLYGASDREQNNARVLQAVLEDDTPRPGDDAPQ